MPCGTSTYEVRCAEGAGHSLRSHDVHTGIRARVYECASRIHSETGEAGIAAEIPSLQCSARKRGASCSRVCNLIGPVFQSRVCRLHGAVLPKLQRCALLLVCLQADGEYAKCANDDHEKQSCYERGALRLPS